MSDTEPYVEKYKPPKRNNVDLLVDKVLDDNTEVKRIGAIAQVIGALGGQTANEPNDLKEDEPVDMGVGEPFDFSEVEGVDVPGVGSKKVSIIKTPES